jgi:membrane-associated phospholipid phosphatase
MQSIPPIEAALSPLPPQSRSTVLSTARRRLALLICLVAGLVLFSIWLPDGAWTAMFTALLAKRALAGMLILFALLAVSLVWSAGQRLDAWVFLLFNLRGYHRPWLDRVMWLATQAGNVATAVAVAGLSFVLNARGLAVETILGTLTLWLLVETIKALTDRARPFLDLQAARVIGWRERGRSFPSGHTAQAFFLATLFHGAFQPGLGGTVALYGIAALVGFTRMYVGAHYPRDVIAGAVLGAVWGSVATLVDPSWLQMWLS